MRIVKLFILLFGLCCTQLHAAPLPDEVGTWLEKLDQSLDKKSAYENIKHQRIAGLQTLLTTSSNIETKYDASMQLFEEYKSYQCDSALHYAHRCLHLATRLNVPAYIIASKCNVAFCQISSGTMFEAYKQLDSIHPADVTPDVKNLYYSVWAKFWRENADLVKGKPYYNDYNEKSNRYLDSLLLITQAQSADWWAYKGTILARQGKSKASIKAFNLALKDKNTNPHKKAMWMAELAWSYRSVGDDTNSLISFIKSAIYDNETSTREITALYLVAKTIYKMKETDRAEKYVRIALDNITSYNTRQRQIEIGEIIPIIERDRYATLSHERNWLLTTTILTITLIIWGVFGFVHIRRQNNKLRSAQTIIKGQLNQLSKANSQLQEANKIKTEYIGRSLYTNSEFIDRIAHIFRKIDKCIILKEYESLKQIVGQSSLNKERDNIYKVFDEAFLKLYPDYIEKYNLLFEEKDRKVPTLKNTLTSEMRIFALIRLGVNDSERIARFLDYSIHTVNTYKTRIKNRSIVENDTFEAKIMEI